MPGGVLQQAAACGQVVGHLRGTGVQVGVDDQIDVGLLARQQGATLGPPALPTGDDVLIGTYCQDTVWLTAGGDVVRGPDDLAGIGAAVIDCLIETAGQDTQKRRARLERLLAQRYRRVGGA